MSPHLKRLAVHVAALGAVFVFFASGATAGEEAYEPEEEEYEYTDLTAPAVFAQVGDTAITFPEFENAVLVAAGRKFYHGHPPLEALRTLRYEVGNQLIERALLLHEARRRNLQPDAQTVARVLSEYERHYRENPRWQRSREQLLPRLTKSLEEDDMLRQLFEAVRDAVTPDTQQVHAYYVAHPDKFTEPEWTRVSLILLSVDPSSNKETWDRTQAEAQALVAQLRKGADFAELARLRSGDESATRGGDMGYLHRGMLSETLQEAVDRLQPGKVSEPLRVLQGIAVVRLDERMPARHIVFAEVEPRVRELWLREQTNADWNALIARLKRSIPVVADERHYQPTSASDRGQNGPK